MELDRYLSHFIRRTISLPGGWRLPGVWRLVEPLRRYYAARYRNTRNPWTIISDYDGNLKFKVDRSSYMGSVIYWRGYHSLRELRWLNRMLKPDMVFADIGANQGEFTLCAAKRLTRGKVLAFEPIDSIFQHLMGNIQINQFHNVLAYNVALSDQSGFQKMFTSEDLILHHSFHEGLATIFPTQYRSKEMGIVRVEKFDEIFEKTGLNRLDIVKIDVEGAELHVLRGAARTLDRFKPTLILEINEETFRAAGYSTGDVLDFLEKLNYRNQLIDRTGNLVSVEGRDLPALCNIVCQWVS